MCVTQGEYICHEWGDIPLEEDLPNEIQTTLTKNLNLWKSKNITSYSFDTDIDNIWFHKHFTATVVKNKIVDIQTPPPISFLDNTISKENQKTIDDYFDLIQDAINKNYYLINVEYDSTYGYPTAISLDYNKNMMDEEIAYHLSNFKKN
jgi:hypothetical protein